MTVTSDQLAAMGRAARSVLQYAWAREPRNEALVVNGLIAVGKTAFTEPVASSALLRQALQPAHLAKYGYAELTWIARQIVAITKSDPSLAVDVYRAAYGHAEQSTDSTNMGDSAILALRSNKRQDYESSWYQLSAALPEILEINLEAAVRSLVVGLAGYVRRERAYEAYPGEPSISTFSIGDVTATFNADWSHSWYRGGLRQVKDAPMLLKAFDKYLDQIASDADVAAKITRVLATLSHEPSVTAAIWGSLLVAGTRHPTIFAQHLLPLARATPMMLSSDTRHQLGNFIAAAYPSMKEDQRSTIEAALLGLTDDNKSERSKGLLVSCIPKQLIATDSMRLYVEGLEQSGQVIPNGPPMQFTTSVTTFDSDAYLASEGIPLKEPENATIRTLMRDVEALSAPDIVSDLSRASVKRQLRVVERLYASLNSRDGKKASKKLVEHATGHLADAVGRLARATPSVLNAPNIGSSLKRILLFCSRSENPHYSVKHERNFHQHVSWGAPSARTSAAEGLMNLSRANKKRDVQAMAVIRKLARDRVPEVRLQVVQNLGMMRAFDPAWAWSEIEHVLNNEPTRGVVSGAINAVARLSFLDVPKAIRLLKIVLRRYQNKHGAGMSDCRSLAEGIICDIHIYRSDPEADRFVASLLKDILGHTEVIQDLVARSSENLLKGTVEKPNALEDAFRRRTLDLYRLIVERAFSEIETRAAAHGIHKFDTWSATDQDAVRKMFSVLETVSMQFHFASGARGDGSEPVVDVSAERSRLYQESQSILQRLTGALVAPIAHHLIQTLETFIPLDPPGVFALIARSVRSASEGGYGFEPMAANLVVRIVERYLADYRFVFADKGRLNDLMDCLDVFVRAGWPAAQSLTFKLGEIWR